MTVVKSKSLRSIGLVALLALVLAFATTQAQTSMQEPAYTEGELLVQVSRYVEAKSIADVFPDKGVRPVELL